MYNPSEINPRFEPCFIPLRGKKCQHQGYDYSSEGAERFYEGNCFFVRSTELLEGFKHRIGLLQTFTHAVGLAPRLYFARRAIVCPRGTQNLDQFTVATVARFPVAAVPCPPLSSRDEGACPGHLIKYRLEVGSQRI